MIKYSLALLATVIVVFSTGCDNDCCGDVQKNDPAPTPSPSPETNVAPVILNLMGVTNNSTKTCTPAEVLNLAANASDPDNNLDTSTYTWKVDGTPVTNGTVDCPADGQTRQVCVTVKDEKGLESNEACVTLQGKAEPAACPTLEITAIDRTDPTHIVNGVNDSATPNNKPILGGHIYDFHHTRENCPMTCTWTTLISTKIDGDFALGNTLDCIDNGTVVDTAGHIVLTNNDTTQPSVEVHTCGAVDPNDNTVSKYKEIKVEVNCDDGSSAVQYFDITLP